MSAEKLLRQIETEETTTPGFMKKTAAAAAALALSLSLSACSHEEPEVEANPENLETISKTEQILLTDAEIDALVAEKAIPSGLSDQEFLDAFEVAIYEAENAGKTVGSEEVLDDDGVKTNKSMVVFEDNEHSSYTVPEWAEIISTDQSQWYNQVLWGPEDSRSSKLVHGGQFAINGINENVIENAESTGYKYDRTSTFEMVESGTKLDGGRTITYHATTHDNFIELFPDHPEGDNVNGAENVNTIETTVSEDGETEYVSYFESTSVNKN